MTGFASYSDSADVFGLTTLIKAHYKDMRKATYWPFNHMPLSSVSMQRLNMYRTLRQIFHEITLSKRRTLLIICYYISETYPAVCNRCRHFPLATCSAHVLCMNRSSCQLECGPSLVFFFFFFLRPNQCIYSMTHVLLSGRQRGKTNDRHLPRSV